MHKNLPIFFVALSLLLTGGCAGSRQKVTFDTLEYPASMSHYLLDQKQKKIGPSDYTTLANVKLDQTGWGVLYSYLPINKVDFSAALNREVATREGDGVVNLKVSNGGGCFGWNLIPFVGAAPVWPGCVNVHVTADIVRVRPK